VKLAGDGARQKVTGSMNSQNGPASNLGPVDPKKIPDFYTAVASLNPEAPENAQYRQFLYGFQKDYNEYVHLTQQLETAKASGAKLYEIRQLEGQLRVAESKLKERRSTPMFAGALGQAVETRETRLAESFVEGDEGIHEKTEVFDKKEIHSEMKNNSQGDEVEAIIWYNVKEWGEELREAARLKIEYENNGSYKTTVIERPRNLRKIFQTYHNMELIPAGMDVDHKKSLQNGGDNSMDNLWLLDSRLNRSFGAQMMHRMKGYPEDTHFRFVLKDRE